MGRFNQLWAGVGSHRVYRQAAIQAIVSAAVGNITADTGEISYFGSDTPPSGWLKCNGAAISRTTYADLFAIIGETWGAGDGSTTFNLPDLRGEFARGWDDGRGIDSGRAIGSWQNEAFKSHRHDLSARIQTQWDPTGGNNVPGIDSGGGGSTQADINTSYTGGSETRPRNVAALFMIKY